MPRLPWSRLGRLLRVVQNENIEKWNHIFHDLVLYFCYTHTTVGRPLSAMWGEKTDFAGRFSYFAITLSNILIRRAEW